LSVDTHRTATYNLSRTNRNEKSFTAKECKELLPSLEITLKVITKNLKRIVFTTQTRASTATAKATADPEASARAEATTKAKATPGQRRPAASEVECAA